MTQGFNEWCSSQIIMIKSEVRAAYTAGVQSRQSEIDELQKRIDILLSEVYLMTDAMGYHRVLNILKGTNQ